MDFASSSINSIIQNLKSLQSAQQTIDYFNKKKIVFPRNLSLCINIYIEENHLNY
jgi:hypothetical protein